LMQRTCNLQIACLRAWCIAWCSHDDFLIKKV